MRFRVVREHDEAGAKPFAFIVEENGVQIEKRDYKTLEAALNAREKFVARLRGNP